jgi:hypothetical protein
MNSQTCFALQDFDREHFNETMKAGHDACAFSNDVNNICVVEHMKASRFRNVYLYPTEEHMSNSPKWKFSSAVQTTEISNGDIIPVEVWWNNTEPCIAQTWGDYYRYYDIFMVNAICDDLLDLTKKVISKNNTSTSPTLKSSSQKTGAGFLQTAFNTLMLRNVVDKMARKHKFRKKDVSKIERMIDLLEVSQTGFSVLGSLARKLYDLSRCTGAATIDKDAAAPIPEIRDLENGRYEEREPSEWTKGHLNSQQRSKIETLSRHGYKLFNEAHTLMNRVRKDPEVWLDAVYDYWQIDPVVGYRSDLNLVDEFSELQKPVAKTFHIEEKKGWYTPQSVLDHQKFSKEPLRVMAIPFDSKARFEQFRCHERQTEVLTMYFTPESISYKQLFNYLRHGVEKHYSDLRGIWNYFNVAHGEGRFSGKVVVVPAIQCIPLQLRKDMVIVKRPTWFRETEEEYFRRGLASRE